MSHSIIFAKSPQPRCPKHGLVKGWMGLCLGCIDELNRANLSPEVYEKGCYDELVRLAKAEGYY